LSIGLSSQKSSISKLVSARSHSSALAPISWRGPISSARCSPLAATLSAGENFQSG
jgi:hypothetical protein